MMTIIEVVLLIFQDFTVRCFVLKCFLVAGILNKLSGSWMSQIAGVFFPVNNDAMVEVDWWWLGSMLRRLLHWAINR